MEINFQWGDLCSVTDVVFRHRQTDTYFPLLTYMDAVWFVAVAKCAVVQTGTDEAVFFVWFPQPPCWLQSTSSIAVPFQKMFFLARPLRAFLAIAVPSSRQ